MTLRRLGRVLAVAALAAIAAPAAVSAGTVEVAPVARLPFPERGYVVGLPEAVRPDAAQFVVRENGSAVGDVRVAPLAGSGVRFGVVLAIDASESMAGEPFAEALKAAKGYLSRRKADAHVGLVAFNGQVTVLSAPTRDGDALARALGRAPALAYGTHIYDALERSVRLVRDAKIAAGSIVLLSDGADLGSTRTIESAIAAARRERVRIFTVGLRSGAFDAAALRSIAARTGGSYVEATSADDLVSIYAALGRRLESEYLVRYRSDARPSSLVRVEIRVKGHGAAEASYVSPKPARIAPFHRPFLSRFVLSTASIVAVALLVAALVGWALHLLVRRPRTNLAERIEQFSRSKEEPTAPLKRELAAAGTALARNRFTGGWWTSLERDLEIARIDVAPTTVATATIGATVAVVLLLALFAPVVAVVGLATPLLTRAIVRWKLRRVRNDFADQLPAALQVLASALRAGHSFSGALGVVVENVHEPARAELRRVVHDDQLGVLPEIALRRMGDRMASRDVEQVALLAELQRTAGGNSAEVIDTVVATIRQRGELRRLVRTLTAQGRMARWILTALPAVMALFLWFMHPETMQPFFASTGGQIALVIAAAMVAAGSLVIQRIVDIEV
jgi:tight adherence protein B